MSAGLDPQRERLARLLTRMAGRVAKNFHFVTQTRLEMTGDGCGDHGAGELPSRPMQPVRPVPSIHSEFVIETSITIPSHPDMRRGNAWTLRSRKGNGAG